MPRFIEVYRLCASPQNKLTVSVAGPDATKIGTDFAVVCGALMDQASGVTAVALPQVPLCLLRAAESPASSFALHMSGSFPLLPTPPSSLSLHLPQL